MSNQNEHGNTLERRGSRLLLGSRQGMKEIPFKSEREARDMENKLNHLREKQKKSRNVILP
jgi:hypothetical protein